MRESEARWLGGVTVKGSRGKGARVLQSGLWLFIPNENMVFAIDSALLLVSIFTTGYAGEGINRKERTMRRLFLLVASCLVMSLVFAPAAIAQTYGDAPSYSPPSQQQAAPQPAQPAPQPAATPTQGAGEMSNLPDTGGLPLSGLAAIGGVALIAGGLLLRHRLS